MDRPMFYILDENKQLVEEPDAHKWSEWFQNVDARRVGYIELPYRATHIDVSTVCLGMDHSHLMQGEPVLFETMVFGPSEIVNKLAELSERYDTSFEVHEIQERWHTYAEAVQGHDNMVRFVAAALSQIDKEGNT